MPNVSGLPGFCATFQKSRSHADFVHRRLHVVEVADGNAACRQDGIGARGFRNASRISSGVSRAIGSGIGTAPASATAAASVYALLFTT